MFTEEQYGLLNKRLDKIEEMFNSVNSKLNTVMEKEDKTYALVDEAGMALGNNDVNLGQVVEAIYKKLDGQAVPNNNKEILALIDKMEQLLQSNRLVEQEVRDARVQAWTNSR